MMIRTALSDKAREELVEFCAKNLKAGLDPVRYADNYDVDLGEVDGEGAVFEIPAHDCRRGHVVDIIFTQNVDFITEELEG